MNVDGGRRFELGERPTVPSEALNMNGTSAVSDNPPGGGDPAHEQDGHMHAKKCLSRAS